jgi:CubicO group peptidase (beta-lactamase class C family)
MRQLFSILILGMMSSAFTMAQEPSAEILAKIEDPLKPGSDDDDGFTFQELMEKYEVPGVSIAVFKDYKIEWVKTYGVKDIGTKEPITPDTLFQGGSLSKCLAAVAAVKASEDGVFSLDDNINSILTTWKLEDNDNTAVRNVTPRMLISHTAGTSVSHVNGYAPNVFLPTLTQILDGSSRSNTRRVVVESVPLTRHKYSSGGYEVLEIALEDAYGKTYRELIQDEIFGPAGMTMTTLNNPLDPDQDARAAHAHDKDGNTKEFKYKLYPELAAYGVWTTASDMAKFAIDIQKSLLKDEGVILSQEKAEETLTRTGFGEHGLGFMVWNRGRHYKWFGHYMDSWGYNGMMTASREGGYGMVMLFNGDGGGGLIKNLARRISVANGWKGY